MAYNLEIKPTLILITSGKLVASDYQQLRQVKQNIRRHKFKNIGKVEKNVALWLTTHYTNLYQNGIWKLTPSYGKCLRFGRDYLKKSEDRNTIKSEQYYRLATKNSKYMLCNILWQALGRSWLVTCINNF